MIQLKDLLNEAFAANSKLANALVHLKKNAESVYQEEPEIMAAMSAVKASGLLSKDIFTFASLFPRDSFKIDDIRTGKLEAQINRTYFGGSEVDALNKARALKTFLIAFDNLYKTKTWYNDFR